MPSTSDKQRRFMAAAAHSPEFAKKVGIPVSVAKEYNQADNSIGKIRTSPIWSRVSCVRQLGGVP
jgi:hypothetical protein